MSSKDQNFAARTCPAVCNEGCFCVEGFVRDSNGRCIPVKECPTCAENERYTLCGAMCVGTCENPNPLICPLICASGCICDEKRGFVKNAEGVCVQTSECPKRKN